MDFQMGMIILDLDSKDIMKISNGMTLYGGKFIPTECLVLRVTGWGKTKRGFFPRVGYSYRAFPRGEVSILPPEKCDLFSKYFNATSEGELQPKYRGGRF